MNRITNAHMKKQMFYKEYQNCKYNLLYWIGEQNVSDLSIDDKQKLAQLTSIIGKENIFIIDYNQTNLAFDGIFDEMFEKSNQHWLNQKKWAWNMADIPEMVWSYSHFTDDQHDKIPTNG